MRLQEAHYETPPHPREEPLCQSRAAAFRFGLFSRRKVAQKRRAGRGPFAAGKMVRSDILKEEQADRWKHISDRNQDVLQEGRAGLAR